jgi:pseudouridine-5'-monophosphatase
MDERQGRLFHLATPLPGALRLVQHLHAHGIPIALATSSRRFKFLAKAQQSPELFACFEGRTVCCDDFPGVARMKPEPDLFLLAARERLGIDVGTLDGVCTDAQAEVRAKGLVFEDSIVGVLAGKRAGMSGVFLSLGINRPVIQLMTFPLSRLGSRSKPSKGHRFYRREAGPGT